MAKTAESCDLWAVAYCLARGGRLVGTVPGRWMTFLLDDSDGTASEALRMYYRGEALVHAREYAERYREARRLSWTA